MGQHQSAGPAAPVFRIGPSKGGPRHALNRTRIDTASLETEFLNYLRWQGGGKGLTRATMERFARDIHTLLQLEHDSDLVDTVMRMTQDGHVVTLERFRDLVKRLAERDAIPLSESLQVDLHADDEPIVIEKASAFAPADESRFVPPAQLFAREWSLVFSCLETVDCNNVNAVSGRVCAYAYVSTERAIDVPLLLHRHGQISATCVPHGARGVAGGAHVRHHRQRFAQL